MNRDRDRWPARITAKLVRVEERPSDLNGAARIVRQPCSPYFVRPSQNDREGRGPPAEADLGGIEEQNQAATSAGRAAGAVGKARLSNLDSPQTAGRAGISESITEGTDLAGKLTHTERRAEAWW